MGHNKATNKLHKTPPKVDPGYLSPGLTILAFFHCSAGVNSGLTGLCANVIKKAPRSVTAGLKYTVLYTAIRGFCSEKQ